MTETTQEPIETFQVPDYEVPASLKDFSEVPEGYISVYIQIDRGSLNHVAQNGLRIEDNKIGTKAPEIEKIFKDVARELGVKFDRTKCVFAYPRQPATIIETFGFDKENEVLTEAKIDPRKCLVADASLYTEAAEKLRSGLSVEEAKTKSTERFRVISGEEVARDWAKSYWESAISLDEYIR